MDIVSFFSKADQKIILAATIGSSIGAIAGMLKDKDDLAKTYINLCQGIVYGGISGPIIYNNPVVQATILITILGYGIIAIDNLYTYDYKPHSNHHLHHYKHKLNNDKDKTRGAFFDHHQ